MDINDTKTVRALALQAAVDLLSKTGVVLESGNTQSALSRDVINTAKEFQNYIDMGR